MLPIMFTNTKRTIIAGTVALAVAMTSAAPAMAFGKSEQQFLKGVLATLLVGGIVHEANKPRQPVYQQPRYQPPVYQPPYRQPQYQQPQYQQPTYQHPTYYDPAPVSIYQTPSAQAFNSYTLNERRRIQSTLSAYGYYRSTIDGSFGPNTYNALQAYAARTGKTTALTTRAGAYGFLDGLLF